MEKIKIADVIVLEGRVRDELGDIEEMANSMMRVGQIQPIVLDDQDVLVAGRRRLAAAQLLGWDEIWFARRDDLDAATKLEIELEENLKRKEMTWVEEVRGLKRLYDLKMQKYGVAGRSISDVLSGQAGPSQQDLARELGKSTATISLDLALARGLDVYPELVEEKSKTAALKRYRVKHETAIREQQAKRARNQEEPTTKLGFDEWKQEQEQQNTDENGKPVEVPRQMIKKISWKGHGTIYNGDSRDVLRFLADKIPGMIDCIVTDPPFGLGMYKEGESIAGQRLAENVGDMYDDDPKAVMDMLDQVFFHAAKLLKPDGHAYVFFHHSRYEEVFLMLRKHFGFNSVDPTPILWIKNTPGVGDPNRMWVYGYEPCFFINRGRPLLKPQAFNYLKYDTVPHGQKIHPTEKPAALLRHLISASVVAGETILEPFAGSGSTVVAAAQLDVKFLGVEKKDSFFRRAVERIAEAIGEHQAAIGQSAPPVEEAEGSRTVTGET